MNAHNGDVYIGLGSNLCRPDLQIKRALITLKYSKGIVLLDCSSFYKSAPVGYNDQPYFVNAVARLKTQLSPLMLLRRLQFIEGKQLRKRTANQNAPRTLDLDILIFGTQICTAKILTIPHPRMLERRFVLEPLVEISPDIVIPGFGMAKNFCSNVNDQDCQRSQQILL